MSREETRNSAMTTVSFSFGLVIFIVAQCLVIEGVICNIKLHILICPNKICIILL